MGTIVVRHRVGDFDTWMKGHQERQEIFASAVTSFQTFQDMDDPESVCLVMEVSDMDKFGAILNDPKVQDAKDRHTVKEPITVSMPVTV
jgi:hypothetical protein